MEGAAGCEVGARFFEWHVTFHHVDDVDPVKELLDEGLGYHARAVVCALGRLNVVTCLTEIWLRDADKNTSRLASWLRVVLIGQPAVKAALTWADTAVMSARPASLALTSAMTLPMPCGPWAPDDSMAALIAAAISSALAA